MADNTTTDGFIDYDKDDAKYAGAKVVVDAELEHLRKRRDSDPENLKGLALSGGGIRAASFSLGIIQALAKNEKLEKFDYMSTVSGGGYIGGALSWLWLDKWKKNNHSKRKFSTGKDDFPYGTGMRFSNKSEDMDRDQASLMRHLRQNGKYLIPGNGITLLSFVSVIFRSIAMGFITLIVLASLFFHLLHYTPIRTHETLVIVFSIGLYGISLLSYAILSAVFKSNPEDAYQWRKRWEILINYIFMISAVLLMIIFILNLNSFLSKFSLESVGGISALLGALLTWFSKSSNNKNLFKMIPTSILVKSGIIITLIGMLVLSDQIALGIKETYYYFSDVNPMAKVIVHFSIAILILFLAYLVPINKVSIHRYYRDRLMEVFTPDIDGVLTGTNTSVSEQANHFSLDDSLPDEDNKMPYHIINSNIILVESKIAKFRGRGGDNFILSPLFSGSNATGWIDSKAFANNSVTLPTAIAISGAAANPDSGVAGQGLTIDPLISVFMSIFNLRLGYWVVNPNPKYQPEQDANPNYLIPGFRETIHRKKLNEEADFVQLSDGGHFENLAMYELIRRHCRLIVCSDAEQDKGFVFDGLLNIIEKARIDFGVKIDISEDYLNKLKYKKSENGELILADRGYIVADINYPNNEPPGKLIYIKTTLPKKCLSIDLQAYKNKHKDFPDETTIDQFFDEKQLEAYRVLGMNIGELLMADASISW